MPAMPAANSEEHCAKCGRIIGNLETVYVSQDQPVCGQCMQTVDRLSGDSSETRPRLSKNITILIVASLLVAIVVILVAFNYHSSPTSRTVGYEAEINDLFKRVLKIQADFKNDVISEKIQDDLALADAADAKLNSEIAYSTSEVASHARKETSPLEDAISEYRVANSDAEEEKLYDPKNAVGIDQFKEYFRKSDDALLDYWERRNKGDQLLRNYKVPYASDPGSN